MNLKKATLAILTATLLFGAIVYIANAATFGRTTAGGSSHSLGPDDTLIGKFTLSENASVTKLTAYIEINFIGTPNVKGLIYSDSSGEPNALKGVTNATAVPADPAWTDLTFASPVYLPAGDYWIGLVSNSNLTSLFYDAGGTAKFQSLVTDYNSPFNPWSGVDSDFNENISVYATYQTESASLDQTSNLIIFE